jgi:hypothetical protein
MHLVEIVAAMKLEDLDRLEMIHFSAKYHFGKLSNLLIVIYRYIFGMPDGVYREIFAIFYSIISTNIYSTC